MPQIVSGFTQNAIKKSSSLFKIITKKIIISSVLEAEFAKLFTNSMRYLEFAIANQYFMICNDWNVDFDKVKILDRTNKSIKRKTGSIGFSVTRGGEIAGEHTVSFIGKNDRIDLVHKAFNRSIFVKGAIEAAVFLSSRKQGLFSLKDIIKS